MASTGSIQRRKTNRKSDGKPVVRLEMKDRMGHGRWITADVIDLSDYGVGLSLTVPLQINSMVGLTGKLGQGGNGTRREACVRWCVERPDGTFRAGLTLMDGKADTADSPQAAPSVMTELDCYEVMQLSPNADPDTIQRVYRILAQRYHPDNAESGNAELFVQLGEAYRILSDPERRAGYDVGHQKQKRVRWKIFDQGAVSVGREAEQRKRRGILDVLYAKALHDPERAEMTIHEIEDLLACPREHLLAALWYLRGKGLIQRGDNARFAITVQGMDEADQEPARSVQVSGLLQESEK